MRRVVECPYEMLLQRARAREQHFALVGKVAEKRSLGQPRPLGDLLDRDLLESALAIELERRLFESAAGIRFPSRHEVIIHGDDSG